MMLPRRRQSDERTTTADNWFMRFCLLHYRLDGVLKRAEIELYIDCR
jgi:hypothetical protein